MFKKSQKKGQTLLIKVIDHLLNNIESHLCKVAEKTKLITRHAATAF